MAPFDAHSTFDTFSDVTPKKLFTPVDATIIAPRDPNGTERARVFVHPNAAPVWEGRYFAYAG